MKKLQTLVAQLVVLILALLSVPSSLAVTLAPLPGPVQKIYDRTDKAVLEGRPGASWLWGPRVQDSQEDYKESPNGKRQVYYFEKGRLEITNPAKDPNDKYYVTSGLLLREMITGQEQTGDNQTIYHGPANVPLAGDFNPGVKDSPTYASLLNLVSFDGSWKSNDLTGKPVTLVLGLGGAVRTQSELAQGVTIAQYVSQTGHNVAKPFIDFMNKTGTVYQNGQYVANQPVFDPLYVFGLPISEPYWSHVTVAGKEQYVLVQAFERRLLTYTPANQEPYKVELGNLGLAYVQWRYQSAPVATDNTDPGYAPPAETDGFKLYNKINSAMQTLTSVKRVINSGGQVVSTRLYQAPDRELLQDAVVYRGQPAIREVIYIGKRIYQRYNPTGKPAGSWFFMDSETSFSWPQNYSFFSNVSINDWSQNWEAGAPVQAGADVVQPLNSSTTDIDGSKYNRTRLVSTKNNVLVNYSINRTLPDNSQLSQNEAFGEYNAPLNIQPPAGAQAVSAVGQDWQAAVSPLIGTDLDLQHLRESIQPQRVLVKFKNSLSTQSFSSLKADFDTQYTALSVAKGWENTGSNLPVLYYVNDANMVETLASLRSNPLVEYAEPDYRRQNFVTQFNDPRYADQYYLKAVRAPRAWDASTGSKNITVAVIDSGADTENPDLKGNIAEGFNSYDDSNLITDMGGHGSWTTGIIGAIGNNGVYGSGVAWNSRLMVIRASGDDPETFSDSSIIKALHYATDHGARVINMSLGSSQDDPALRDAVAYATGKGVVVVVASGNNGSNVPQYPASYPKVVSVGATGWLGQPTNFSGFGGTVTLTAPGVSICNTVRLGLFTCADGTSASAPIVSGAAALILAVNPQLNADQVRAILIASVKPVPGKQPGQRDDKYGYGALDIATAVRMAATNQIPGLPA